MRQRVAQLRRTRHHLIAGEVTVDAFPGPHIGSLTGTQRLVMGRMTPTATTAAHRVRQRHDSRAS